MNKCKKWHSCKLLETSSDNDQDIHEQLKEYKTDDDSSYLNFAFEQDQETPRL